MRRRRAHGAHHFIGSMAGRFQHIGNSFFRRKDDLDLLSVKLLSINNCCSLSSVSGGRTVDGELVPESRSSYPQRIVASKWH